jgi:hypothetical protein
MSLALYQSRVRSSDLLDRNTCECSSPVLPSHFIQSGFCDEAFPASLTVVPVHELLERRFFCEFGANVVYPQARPKGETWIFAWCLNPGLINKQKF